MELRNRYLGSLVGVHVGDSKGAPFETMSPKQVVELMDVHGEDKFFDYKNPWPKDGNGKVLPAGRPTDDSDQTADLCHSLLVCNGVDSEHLRESLRDSIVHRRSRLWSGKATGGGQTTRDALSDDPERVKRGLANNIGTNGSLMRCAPMALWYGPMCPVEDMLDRCGVTRAEVGKMSAVTHAHQHAIDACWLYTKILVRILSEEDWTNVPVTNPLEERIWSRLYDEYDLPYDPGAWPARGTAEFSLYVALCAFMYSDSFTEGINLTIKVGGDTDTYAAIAGGLLGAYYGYEGIPKEWRETILGHDQMVVYADALLERAMTR